MEGSESLDEIHLPSPFNLVLQGEIVNYLEKTPKEINAICSIWLPPPRLIYFAL